MINEAPFTHIQTTNGFPIFRAQLEIRNLDTFLTTLFPDGFSHDDNPSLTQPT